MTDQLRSYGYGTRLLVSGFGGQIRRVTALGAYEDDHGLPCGEGVTQNGDQVWFLDSQIVKVLE